MSRTKEAPTASTGPNGWDPSSVLSNLSFLEQHYKELKDIKVVDLLVDNGEDDDNPNIAFNLLTIASTGNAAFLDELLRAGLDPDIGDSRGRTPMHIAASKGHEECVMVLLKHGGNVNIKDKDGNSPLWDAISTKHHSVFRILYHCAALSDPFVAGDLLCLAAKRNSLSNMKELLKHGINVDSKNSQKLTALQIATAENHIEMVNLLVMNGANVEKVNHTRFSSEILDKMVQQREVGHMITVHENTFDGNLGELYTKDEVARECKSGKLKGGCYPRVSIYRGHPVVRKKNGCNEAGRLIKLPISMEQLKQIAGEKLGCDALNAVIMNDEGAEIDCIEVIRDNDKLYIVEDTCIHTNFK